MTAPVHFWSFGVRQASVETAGSAPRGWIGGRNNPAGSATDGLTSIGGVISPMQIEVRDAATRRLIHTTGSDSAGRWESVDLDASRPYDLLAKDPDGGYEDITVGDITPSTKLFGPRETQYLGISLGVPFTFDLRTRTKFGTGPITVSSSGTLPTGVSFASNIYSGTPIAVDGVYTVAATVTDSLSDVAEFDLSFVVTSIPLSVDAGSVPAGVASTAHPGHTFTATGGLPPYTFAVTAGTLPAGLSLSSGGVLSGTCPASSSYDSVTITVTDDLAQTADREFVIPITSADARRYWRINITASNGHASMNQVEFAAYPGGPNQAVGGTASSNGYYGSYAPANAFDGNYATIFAAVSASAGWLMYDFGAPVEVGEVRIMPRGTNYQSPNTWTIESSSDASTWDVISTQTGQTYAVAGWTDSTFKAYAVP